MSHIHLEDGAFTPFWVIVWSLLALGIVWAALFLIRRKNISPRLIAIAAMCASVGFAVFQVEIPTPIGPVHMNFRPLIGILIGPGLGSLVVIVINIFSATIGHGGWGMIAANSLVNMLEITLAYYSFRALKAISTVDAICHVVRALDDETVFHVDGSVNPLRDINYVQSELLLADLIFCEARIERLTKDIKRKNEPAKEKELNLMRSAVEYLCSEKPLRLMPLTDDDKKMLNGYPLLTRKNMLIALNVNEYELTSDELTQRVEAACLHDGINCVQVSLKIEEELAAIEHEEEREVFCNELGITRSALEKITQLSYDALNRISFFTVGEDEVRAWTVPSNAYAPQAGGTIHSDIERGFIRAEHMHVDRVAAEGRDVV